MARYYFPDSGQEDRIFGGESVCCLDLPEVIRLSQEWECNLLDDMHEATPDEIEEYGVYDTDPRAGFSSYQQYRAVILSCDESDRHYRYYL